MKTEFVVQNPHSIPVTREVDVGGEKVNAAIDGFEVSLRSADGMSGSLVLRYFGQAAKHAKELFVNDDVVEAVFTKKGGGEDKPKAK